MIKRIGAFHFGNPVKSARIVSLRNALSEKSRAQALDDCLIVLPEAFNVRGGYRDDPCPRPLDTSIPGALVTLSKEFKVAFVAGLIARRRQQHRYNCAYLIDNTTYHLLSCKKQPDGTCNYEPCAIDDKPISHRGLWIAALICLDAGTSEFSNRSMEIRAAITANKRQNAVLCIPADTLSINTQLVAERWAVNFHAVIANCNPSPPSILRMKASSEAVLIQGADNRIEIIEL